VWDKLVEVKWSIINVYGPAQVESRDSFLSELASFCTRTKEPYLIGGDFNILRFASEKNKRFHPNKFSDMFDTILNMNELRKIHIAGGCFTWSNNQVDPTLEKLDRALMNIEWEILFPGVHITKKPRESLITIP
jgi:hypothetical protein